MNVLEECMSGRMFPAATTRTDAVRKWRVTNCACYCSSKCWYCSVDVNIEEWKLCRNPPREFAVYVHNPVRRIFKSSLGCVRKFRFFYCILKKNRRSKTNRRGDGFLSDRFGIGVSTVTLFFIRRLGTTKNNFDFNRWCSPIKYMELEAKLLTAISYGIKALKIRRKSSKKIWRRIRNWGQYSNAFFYSPSRYNKKQFRF